MWFGFLTDHVSASSEWPFRPVLPVQKQPQQHPWEAPAKGTYDAPFVSDGPLFSRQLTLPQSELGAPWQGTEEIFLALTAVRKVRFSSSRVEQVLREAWKR